LRKNSQEFEKDSRIDDFAGKELWINGFEMCCLQCSILKGVASFLSAFCPVPVVTAAVVASGWPEVYRAEEACSSLTYYEIRR